MYFILATPNFKIVGREYYRRDRCRYVISYISVNNILTRNFRQIPRIILLSFIRILLKNKDLKTEFKSISGISCFIANFSVKKRPKINVDFFITVIINFFCVSEQSDRLL